MSKFSLERCRFMNDALKRVPPLRCLPRRPARRAASPWPSTRPPSQIHQQRRVETSIIAAVLPPARSGRMSLFRSFVASTSALPSTAAAVSCSTSLRGLATAAPEASTSSSALVHPKGPTDVKHRWNRLVPKAIKARLPPAFINQNLDPKPVFPPKAPLETPAKFVGVIGRGIVKKLKGKVDLEMMAWEDLMNWRSKQWSEKGGLEPKDRRHVLTSELALSCASEPDRCLHLQVPDVAHQDVQEGQGPALAGD